MHNKYIMAGVIGWPVAHSRSPAIHNYWIRENHLNGAYGLFPVEENNLEKAIRGLAALGIAGCNITIPHKISAMHLADWVDPLASRMGAINTIVVQPDGALHGFNNDGFGFIHSLQEAQPDWNANKGPAVVLGAGGAARAVVVSLLDAGSREIRILNRTRGRADDIAQEFGTSVTAFHWNERHQALNGCSLLVNTTSLGMHGQDALDIELIELPTSALVSDIIYVPLETPLLARARQRGNTTVNGLGMLLHQARPAFQAWFGVMPEVSQELRKTIIASL